MTVLNENLQRFLAASDGFSFHIREYIESTRFAPALAEEFETFCRAWQEHPGGEANPWTERKDAIRSVTAGIPAFAEIDWDRPDYHDTVPLMDRKAILADPGRFLAPWYEPQRLWKRPTSGTTGPPLTMWYHPKFFFDFQLFAVPKIAHVAGAPMAEVVDRPVLVLALFDNRNLHDRVWASPSGPQGLTLRLVVDASLSEGPRSVRRMLERHRPAVLTLKPLLLNALVARADESLRRAVGCLDLLVVSGTTLDPAWRERAEHELGRPVINAYGLSEVGIVASECRHRRGLHVYDTAVIPEILTADGELSGEGVGELVLSTVANPAMPLLRYRTGDRVALVRTLCECGRNGSLLRRIEGRLIESFRFSCGTVFPPTHLAGLFDSFALREFRVTQTQLNRVVAEVELLPKDEGPRSDPTEIRSYIARMLPPHVEVEVVATVLEAGPGFQRYRALASTPQPEE